MSAVILQPSTYTQTLMQVYLPYFTPTTAEHLRTDAEVSRGHSLAVNKQVGVF